MLKLYYCQKFRQKWGYAIYSWNGIAIKRDKHQVADKLLFIERGTRNGKLRRLRRVIE